MDKKKLLIYIAAGILVIIIISMYQSCSAPSPTQSFTAPPVIEKKPSEQESDINAETAIDSGDQDLINFYTAEIDAGKDTDGLYYYKRGLIYQKMQQYRMAIQDYSRAINIKPDAPFTYYNRALASAESGMTNEAIADYTKALELLPNDPRILNARGLLYVELKQYDKAMQDYQAAIAADPGYDPAYYNLGTLYERQKKFVEAKEQYDLAISNNGKQADKSYESDPKIIQARLLESYYRRAVVEATLQDFAAALKDVTFVIENDPKSSKAYMLRSLIYEKTGNTADAISDRAKADDLSIEKVLRE